MYLLVICPLKSIELNAGIKAGSDHYDHFGILIRDGSRIPLILPAVNVDPSTRSVYPALRHGFYRLLKARHRWKHPKGDMDGFFVCRADNFPDGMHWQGVHGHPTRLNLPGLTRGGREENISYINIHEGGEGPGSYDWSDGCITLPARFMRQLYHSVGDLEQGFLVFSDTYESAAKVCKKLLKEE